MLNKIILYNIIKYFIIYYFGIHIRYRFFTYFNNDNLVIEVDQSESWVSLDSTRGIIDSYYESLSNHDLTWQELWAKDGIFTDSSGTLYAAGSDAILASFTPFLKGVKDVTITQRIIDGNWACYIVNYVYINKSGESMKQKVAETWQMANGRLQELTIYFDITAYRKFMFG